MMGIKNKAFVNDVKKASTVFKVTPARNAGGGFPSHRHSSIMIALKYVSLFSDVKR